MAPILPPTEGVTTPPTLYVEDVPFDGLTLWMARPHHSLGDQALMVRTGANAVAFDAIVDLLAEREQIERLTAELLDHHIGHGDYRSVGKRLRDILTDPQRGA